MTALVTRGPVEYNHCPACDTTGPTAPPEVTVITIVNGGSTATIIVVDGPIPAATTGEMHICQDDIRALSADLASMKTRFGPAVFDDPRFPPEVRAPVGPPLRRRGVQVGQRWREYARRSR